MFDSEYTMTEGHREFRITVVPDEMYPLPWLEEDGHGPVSDWTSRPKKPGERVLHADRGGAHRYYDFAEALRIAWAGEWDAPPIGEGTRKQKALRAVEADFKRLRAWCNDEWHYVGVIAQEKCKCCGDFTGPSESLWGIESDAESYLGEVASELVGQIMSNHAEGGTP